MTGPRVSIKAIIIFNEKILLIEKNSGQGKFYIFPGGGQDRFETLEEALCREVLEETGYKVKLDRVLFIRDYIGRNHEFADTSSNVHQLEIHVKAVLESDIQETATQPDTDQTGAIWIPVSQLSKTELYPKIAKTLKLDSLTGDYLGDVN